MSARHQGTPQVSGADALRGGLGYARALWTVAALPAARRIVPVYLGAALPAGVIFGPNGMHPADLAAAAEASPGVRLALWCGWLLLGLPGVHVLFRAPSARYLRWLPVPRALPAALLAAALVLAQAPWGLLWAAARGPQSMLAAVLGAAGWSALWALLPRGRGERALRGAGLLGVLALVAAAAPAWALAGAGAAALVLGAPAAWTRAVEQARARSRTLPQRRPSAALALLYARALRRVRPGLLVRLLLVCALGAGLVALASAANQLDSDARALLATMLGAAVLSVCASSVAAAVLAAEEPLDWLLRSLGTRPAVRQQGLVLAAAGQVAVLGAAYGAAAGWGSEPIGWARVFAASALLGAGLGGWALAAAQWARRAVRQRARERQRDERPGDVRRLELDDGRLLVAALAAMAAAMLGLWLVGEIAAVAVAAAGIALGLREDRRVS
ncbi:hypothetical protein [Haliangium ochraceum]|uniref:Uncharacterized protein n=1 Tax=Haliangium ochraceum (strain DSM 14365 / JCM 11303 / SMP-2) TaxID=502025 RepID=D0LXA5_HALO1|nr:hypothetical protein [Haliangium ochraceum]ACY16147.1 conserved hypothetical protein [Haliangium ochraceum DSM 14365]